MIKWLEVLIASIGGGTVVLIGITTVFKGLFIKFFETGIESSFEKKLEKFKNDLERSTRAYEMILDREMRFYEQIEPIIAELIPIENDWIYFLRDDESVDRHQNCESFRENFKRYCELVKVLKNLSLVHHSYIPQEVFSVFSSVVNKMQNDIYILYEMAKLLFSAEYDKIDYEKCQIMVDEFLMCIAIAENMVRKRLNELSGGNYYN